MVACPSLLILRRRRPRAAARSYVEIYRETIFTSQIHDASQSASQPGNRGTLQDSDLQELYDWAPNVLDRLKKLLMLRDVTTDQQMSGMTTTLTIDRDQVSMKPATSDFQKWPLFYVSVIS
jgi:multidrug efflux pump subunit AcrB